VSNLRYWLTPGMGVKRHVTVISAGVALLVVGVLFGAFWLWGKRARAETARARHDREPLVAALGGLLALFLLLGGWRAGDQRRGSP
jgi:hypothetical protein